MYLVRCVSIWYASSIVAVRRIALNVLWIDCVIKRNQSTRYPS
jgi:hypothetical protein